MKENIEKRQVIVTQDDIDYTLVIGEKYRIRAGDVLAVGELTHASNSELTVKGSFWILGTIGWTMGCRGDSLYDSMAYSKNFPDKNRKMTISLQNVWDMTIAQ